MKYEEIEPRKLYVSREGGQFATYMIITDKRTDDFTYLIYHEGWSIKDGSVEDWKNKSFIYQNLREIQRKPSKDLIRDLFDPKF